MLGDVFILFCVFFAAIASGLLLSGFLDYSLRLRQAVLLYQRNKSRLDHFEQETVEVFLNKAAFARGRKPPYPARGLGERVVYASPPSVRVIEVTPKYLERP